MRLQVLATLLSRAPQVFGVALMDDGRAHKCVAGSYLSDTRTCTSCSPGTYSSDGASKCEECQAGTFTPYFGASKCQPCPPGAYSRLGGVVCTSCEAGHYSSSEMAESCLPCPVNHATNKRGSTVCTPCPAGKEAPQEGSLTCTLISSVCPPGNEWFGDACKPCNAGFFKPEAGPNPCKPCPKDYISDRKRNECIPCGTGGFTERAGATPCLTGDQPYPNCPVGEEGAIVEAYWSYLSPTLHCKSCQSGFAKHVPGPQACQPDKCKSGFFASKNSDDCLSCDAVAQKIREGGDFDVDEIGKVCEAVRIAMRKCGPGYYATGTGCEICPAGTFSLGGNAVECTPCMAGTAPNSNSSSCESCKAGTYSGEKSGTCLKCQAGMYSGRGSSTCTPCEAGYTSLDNITCMQGCPPGEVYSGSNCNKCEPGTFKSTYGTEKCQPCPSGSFADSKGSIACTACSEGSYSTGTSCVKGVVCPSGRVLNGTVCETCPPGSFADLSDSECTPCAPGTFSSTAGASVCMDCPLYEYAKDPGSTACTKCSVDSAKQKGCQVACMFGEYLKDGSLCVPCPKGTYSGTTYATECTNCYGGLTTAREGSKGSEYCMRPGDIQPCELIVADAKKKLSSLSTSLEELQKINCPSHYGQIVRDLFRPMCDAGEYSNDGKAVDGKCIECPAGHFNGLKGARYCPPCPAGSFVATSGAVACKDCQAGYFSATAGAKLCTPCGWGMTSPEGASSFQACHYSTTKKIAAAIIGSIGVRSIRQNSVQRKQKAFPVTDKIEVDYTLPVLVVLAVSVISVAVMYLVVWRRHHES